MQRMKDIVMNNIMELLHVQKVMQKAHFFILNWKGSTWNILCYYANMILLF